LIYTDKKKDTLGFFFDLQMIGRIWLPFDYKDWKLHVSILYHITRGIIDTIFAKMPQWFDHWDVILQLLSGWLVQHFYALWDKADELYEQLYDEYDWNVERKYMWIWDKIISYFLEIDEEENEDEEEEKAYERLSEIMEDIDNLNVPELEDSDIPLMYSIFNKNVQWYIVSEEWLDFLRMSKLTEEEIEAFEEVYLFRQNLLWPELLHAIIAFIYFDVELFFYYNPAKFEWGICSRDRLSLIWTDTYIIIDFGNIIKQRMCPHCIENMPWKELVKQWKENKATKEQVIDAMFDDLRQQAQWICRDELEVSMQWKVKNNNKYPNIEQAVPYGDVWFHKHWWKKAWVKFEVKDDLKKRIKRLKWK
jgi:hypothetical protein